MNFVRFCEDFELDRETGIEMLQLFYDTSLVDLERIESGIARGLAENVADGAHSIKGAARNLGIESIVRVAGDLEMKGRRRLLDEQDKDLTVLKGQIDLLGQRLQEGDVENIEL